MEHLDIVKGMNGAALIGGILGETEKNISALPFVLAGDMDDELYRGFYLMHHGAGVEYRPGDAHCHLMLARLKDYIRSYVQGFFREVERQEIMQQRVRLEQMRESLKASNRPHAAGTVSEIAAQLGISKSEVRRRKAAGTLDEFFTKQST